MSKLPLPKKIFLSSILFIAFLFFLPILSKIFWHQFIPSKEWVDSSTYFSLAFGLVFGVIFLVVLIISVSQEKAVTAGSVLSVFLSPFMGYFLGKNLIMASFPMVISLFTGYQTEHIFTVEKADGRGGRRCYSPVTLKEPPLFYDTICGVPDDLRKQLKRDQQIVVEGFGNRFGVFAAEVIIRD